MSTYRDLRPVGLRPDGEFDRWVSVVGVLADDRMLTLCFEHDSDHGWQVELAETHTEVAVGVRTFLIPPPPPTDGIQYGRMGTGQTSLSEVVLREPLESRPVVDVPNGEVRAVFPASDLLEPTRLPDGLRRDYWTVDARVAGPRVHSIWRDLESRYVHIGQGAPALGVLSHPSFYRTGTVGTADVNGHHASWGDQGGPDGEVSVHWEQDGYGIQLMSSAMRLETLLAIGRSLRSAGSRT